MSILTRSQTDAVYVQPHDVPSALRDAIISPKEIVIDGTHRIFSDVSQDGQEVLKLCTVRDGELRQHEGIVATRDYVDETVDVLEGAVYKKETIDERFAEVATFLNDGVTQLLGATGNGYTKGEIDAKLAATAATSALDTKTRVTDAVSKHSILVNVLDYVLPSDRSDDQYIQRAANAMKLMIAGTAEVPAGRKPAALFIPSGTYTLTVPIALPSWSNPELFESLDDVAIVGETATGRPITKLVYGPGVQGSAFNGRGKYTFSGVHLASPYSFLNMESGLGGFSFLNCILDNVGVRNTKMENSIYRDTEFIDGTVFTAQLGSRCVFENCIFRLYQAGDSTIYSFLSGNYKGCRISNCVFDTANSSIFSVAGIFTDLTVSDCTFSGSGPPISLDSSTSNVRIYNNLFDKGDPPSVVDGSKFVTVSGNVFRGRSGLKVARIATGLLVSNNVFEGPLTRLDDSKLTAPASAVLISNNLFTG
jgi:hypothetical protein